MTDTKKAPTCWHTREREHPGRHSIPTIIIRQDSRLRKRRKRRRAITLDILLMLLRGGIVAGMIWLAASRDPDSYTPSVYDEGRDTYVQRMP